VALIVHGIARTRTARVLWLAEELGLAYRHEPVAPGPEGTGSAAFRAINPHGTVPTIEDDGLVLWESLAISLHLARKYGAGGLGAADAAEEARIGQWTLFAATELEPNAHEVLVHTINRPPEAREAAKRDAALAALVRPLATLDQALADGGGFLVGRRFTVADLNVGGVIFYLRGVPDALAAAPHLAAWWQAIGQRPAYQKMRALRGDPP